MQCARAACPTVIREDCATWLAQVEAVVPTIVLRARDERGQDLIDVTVDVDGARVAKSLDGVAVPVDPGPHSVHFEAPGRKAVDITILVAEGDKARSVVAELHATSPAVVKAVPPAPSSGRRALPWIAFGLGAASLGAFVALEVMGHTQLSDLEAGCGAKGMCTPEQVAPVRTKFQVAAVALGVGVAGAAAGGVLLFVGSRDASRPAAFLRVAPTAAGAALGVGGLF
ncbi:Hypothetical protein A7982_03580 [Minicystis rosea]|nr:Hypothetical protein A7982_03580 [Minicystis rosea]